MHEIRLFCPATVANVSCGFDVLGLALEDVGDELFLRRVQRPGVHIIGITGADLPTEPERNAAGIVAQLMLRDAGVDWGIEMEIHKKIKPGSGLGSSAASAGGAAVGVNLLLDRYFDRHQMIRYAMEGEFVACDARIADNVSPVVMGGFCLVRSYDPLDVVPLPVPEQLHLVLLHPQVELKTSESRAVLPGQVPLKTATRQTGNLGGLIAGLYKNDYALIARSLQDHLAEPFRSPLIPHFDAVRDAAMEAGALGGGISGSGPSMFYLCQGAERAAAVAGAMEQVFKPTGIPYKLYQTQVAREGARSSIA